MKISLKQKIRILKSIFILHLKKTVGISLLMFLPDVVMNYGVNIPIGVEPLFIFNLFSFLFLLSFCPRFFSISIIVLFFLMQIVQLNFMVFFGHPISAAEIMNIIKERSDIFDITYIRQTWFVMPMLILTYGITIWILWGLKQRVSLKTIMMSFFVLYLMSYAPMVAYKEKKDIWFFQAGPTRSTLKNSIYTFSYFFFQYIYKTPESSEITYLPYEVSLKEAEAQNVLLIFGESLSTSHMNQFGYDRNTFPRLKKRQQMDKTFSYTQAISPGVSTATSTLLFFNGVAEPGNLKQIQSKESNLFHIAKKNKFKTYYISNQESRLLMDLGDKDIDVIINNDSAPLVFARHKDEGLTHFFEDIDFGKYNFVVLHMRSPHLPYENRYKGREDEFEKWTPAAESKDRLTYYTNTYDNALLYTDMVIDKMIQSFIQKAQKTSYRIYFIADHGQLFNFKGMWGHNNLVIEQGQVPFFTLSNIDKKELPAVLPYFEANKIIAHTLGGMIINPNFDNTYYYHGNNIMYPYDFLSYLVDSNGTIYDVQKRNTKENKKGR